MAFETECQIPEKFKLALDICLTPRRFLLPTVDIIDYEQMNLQNIKRIIANRFHGLTSDHLYCRFGCYLCRTPTSRSNPIYFDSEFRGTSLCTRCITRAFKNNVISYRIPRYEGPVYRLSDIVNAAEKKKKMNHFSGCLFDEINDFFQLNNIFQSSG